MPSTKDDLGGLNSEQWRDLYDCASRLERTLRSGASTIDLRRFLPPADAPHRRAVLHELIKTELEARYVHGQGCLLEEFLRRYPELGKPEELPASLIYEEYRARRVFGEHVALEEYQSRFPLQFEQLRRLVQTNPPPESAEAPPTINRTARPSTPPTEPLSPNTLSVAPLPAAVSASKSAGTASAQRLSSGAEGYQLLERIGKGQFGEVYRALAPGGVVVAVKRIFRPMDDESSQRELRALQKVRELRHPFLLQTHNFQAYEDRLVIVMELADGSLQDRFKICRAAGLPGIPTQELLPYFAEAAEALDFLRDEKLSHRDIKPQNLLHLKGHAKVADFGVARAQESTVDHTTNIGGTPAYMPPEMWRGDISVNSDQYSFAVTWYEMRTGHRVFNAKSQFEIAQQHLNDKPDVSAVPEEEQKVLLRALAKAPEQRYPSCVAFVQALKLATAPPPPAPPPVPVSSGSRPLLAVASLAFALVAVLIALYLVVFRQQPAPTTVDKPGPPKVAIKWQPPNWEPVDATKFVTDFNGFHYYQRLMRKVGSQEVVVVAVPQNSSTDPQTFYITENKIWNDVYAVFMADSISKTLLRKYSGCAGCERLVHGDWSKGGYAPKFNNDPDKEPFFGVEGPEKGRMPVFRETVTEAHCFAEWLGGRLPTRQQWRKAAGDGEDPRRGPFDGDPLNKQGLAVGLLDGPWPVDRGERDVSIYGCRQMASNGLEWTRDLEDKTRTIPLDGLLDPPAVIIQGQSYVSSTEPLTFANMGIQRVRGCTEASFEVSFRIVLGR